MTKFAIVFPGQGSQQLTMLAELAKNYALVEETFNEASSVLGYDLWNVVQNGPLEELNKTWCTQPALLASSVATWRVWQSINGAKPTFMAGHSLGEYSALVCAGIVDFKAAIKLVALRGKFMQEAVPEGTGAMSAIIGLDNDLISKACEAAAQGEIVSPVNFNSPGQVVIAGNKAAVERANEACKTAGAKRAIPLPVSVPSHCLLMSPAADKLADALKNVVFVNGQYPIINNVDVAIETSEDAIKKALIRQLYNPVRWSEVVEYMSDQGIEHLIEMGPGKVLTGLTKRIVGSMTANAINDSVTMLSELEKCNN